MGETAKIHFVKENIDGKSVVLGGVGLVHNKVVFIFSNFVDGDDNYDGELGFLESLLSTKGEAAYRVASLAAVDLQAKGIDPGFSKDVRKMWLDIGSYMIAEKAINLYLGKGVFSVAKSLSGAVVVNTVRVFVYRTGAQKLVGKVTNFALN